MIGVTSSKALELASAPDVPVIVHLYASRSNT
jgi:hypothetical protein